nr:immunoglobulin heavy chain junction region [Mus musculus]
CARSFYYYGSPPVFDVW